MKDFLQSVLKRVKSVELDQFQERAAQFGDKARKAINDIDTEGLNSKRNAIGAKISELSDKARLKIQQIEKEVTQRKIDREIEKARKEEEKRLRLEALRIRRVNFFKSILKFVLLLLLLGILVSIVFHDEILDYAKSAATEKQLAQQRRERESRDESLRKKAPENVTSNKTASSSIPASGNPEPNFLEQCRSRTAATIASLGVSQRHVVSVVDTNILSITRICTSDGSVLVSCSVPDQKMVVTKSSSSCAH